jgi:CBS-domain-containing membrane protein
MEPAEAKAHAFVVDLDAPVYAAVGELLDYKVRQMYVADHDGVLVGVLSTAELLKDLCRHAEEQSNDAKAA